MAQHVRRAGKQLRPHAKTHKCPEIARRQIAAGVVLGLLVEVDVGGRRTGAAPGTAACTLAREVSRRRALRFRGLQGYAGHCAHVLGWKARRAASLGAMVGLAETRRLIEADGIPVEIVAK